MSDKEPHDEIEREDGSSDRGRFRRARELFDLVADLPSDRQARILDEECAGDAELRKVVDSLIDPATAKMAEEIDTYGGIVRSHHTASGSEPTGIHPYRILRRVGEGGMADVYLAQQVEPIPRQVALKVMKAGMASDRILARFEQERMTLAVMEHPNVARVLDAGAADDGRPYFVLEYVDGLPITQYCDKHQLTIPERLGLFLQVCDAVQHAHQKGIVHRDLKPSNVLVAGNGQVEAKVIDFGIAKAIDPDNGSGVTLTEMGQVIGTPEYMSPEQAGLARGDIDTRADIYSLGMLLHELLVGALPFDETNLRDLPIGEMQQVIREVDSPRPSRRLMTLADLQSIASRRQVTVASLERCLRGDMDWVLLKALEKDRDRRYASVSELANDIRHYLANEPVSARRPTATYRFGKFLHRNRVASVAALLVLVALIAATAVSLDFAASERAQRRIADNASIKAGERERDALSALRRVERVTEFQRYMLARRDLDELGAAVLARVRVVFEAGLLQDGIDAARLQSLLAGFDQMVRSSVRADVARGILDDEILKRALTTIDRAFEDDPLTAASLYFNVGMIYRELGFFDEAVEILERAWQLRVDELGTDHADTIAVLHEIGTSYHLASRFADAARCHATVLDFRRREHGEEHHLTLSAMEELAEDWLEIGRIDEGYDLAKRAVDIHRRTGRADGGLARLVETLAYIDKRRGRIGEAQRLFEEVLEIRLAVDDPVPHEVAIARCNIADMLRVEGRLVEAESALRASLEETTRLFGSNHPHVLSTRAFLAATLTGLGKYADALAMYRKLFRLQRRVLGPKNIDTISTLSNIGAMLVALGEYEEAEVCLQDALALTKEVVGTDGDAVCSTVLNLGYVSEGLGRRDEAFARFQEAVDCFRRAFGDRHVDTLRSSRQLGRCLQDCGRLQEAEQLLSRNAALSREVLGMRHSSTAYAFRDYGILLKDLERYDQSEAMLVEAADVAGSSVGKDASLYYEILIELGDVLGRLGRFEEAEEQLREALEGVLRVRGPEHAVTIRARRFEAGLRRRMGDLDEATDMYRQLVDSAHQALGADHPRVVEIRAELCRTLLEAGQSEEARSCLEEIAAAATNSLGESDPATLRIRCWLGIAQRDCGDSTAARLTLRSVVQASTDAFGEDAALTVDALDALASLPE